MKKCKTCDIEKDTKGFYKSKRYKDGLFSECKVCHNAKMRAKRKNDPEHRRKCNESARKSKAKHREKVLEASRIYRENNRESLRLKSLEYTKNNKEKVRASKKRYDKNNPQIRAKIKVKRRTSEKRSIPNWADHTKIKTVYEKAKWLEELTGLKYHVDHIIPLQGENVCGLHVWENLQILEVSLNCSKGNRYVG
jgi:hypothetical protein